MVTTSDRQSHLPGHSVVHSVPLEQCVLQQVTSKQSPDHHNLISEILLFVSDLREQRICFLQNLLS